LLLLLRSKAGAVYYRFCEAGGAIMLNQQEIWKDIQDYEGRYQVSSFGRVKNIKTNTIITGSSDHGYYSIHVRPSKKSKQRRLRVNRLVAVAFVPNPENKPEVNHIDGNTKNNNINNLEWVTHSENMKHALKIGLVNNSGERNVHCKLKEIDVVNIRNRFKNGEKPHNIAKDYPVSMIQINRIINNKTWKHI